jgi:nucleotide-binding universal stress UspA family protein
MTMVVGYPPDGRGKGALHLGGMLARSGGDDLVVACVVPAPWSPGMARIDSEYRKYLDDAADAALDAARSNAPADVPVTFVRHSARSVPVGLLELADERSARLLVLGSSSLGSVTDRLLHSSPTPLSLAPRGFRCKADAEVGRVTVAYGGSSSMNHVVAAAAVAAIVGATLRLASFAVWSRPPYTTTLGTDSEDQVLEEWMETLRATVREALEQVKELDRQPPEIETVIGRGESWGEALEDVEWVDGDVLVVGSSALGPLAQVFLGSRATKVVRHSPVPVVVVPRGTAEELVEASVG